MSREIFKNLPDTTTPLNASKLNGIFNGEESMGSIVVEDITCKNLFDGELEIGAINNTGNNFSDNNTIRSVNFINVKPNTVYTQSSVDNYKTIVFFYDNNKTFISKVGNNLSTNTFTTPSNCSYVKFCTYVSEGATDTTSKFQVELGSVASEFVEHKEYAIMSASDKVALDKLAPSERLYQPDLNNLTGNYMTYCLGASNVPDGTSGYGFLIQIQIPGQAYKKQLFSIFDNDTWYKRTCNNGTWTSWTQL